jgi:hypothetical protein
MAIDKVVSASITDSSVTDAKLSFNSNQFRNIIINGDMSQAQRGTSFTSVSDTAYHLDRFQLYMQNESSVYTVTQESDAPSGLAKSLKLDVTTADTSVASNEEVKLVHKIEGQNLQNIAKGTADAKQITLSFYVKTNKTGLYAVKLFDADNSRDCSGSYTVADTNWNRYTITFPVDTTGTFDNDNARSLEIQWWLVAGSAVQDGSLNTAWRSNADSGSATGQINFADSTSNDWQLTGCQLEIGTAASDFEFLPVDVNLNRCLRYYELLASGDNQVLFDAFYYTATEIRHVVHPKVSMRANPTLDQTSGTDYYRFIRDAANDKFEDFSLDISTPTAVEFFNSTDMSGTQGESGWVRTDVSSSFIALDAEL